MTNSSMSLEKVAYRVSFSPFAVGVFQVPRSASLREYAASSSK